MPTDALLTFGILKLTSLILIEYQGWLRGLNLLSDGYGTWYKGGWTDIMEMRGSGAMRVDNGHESTNYCNCVCCSAKIRPVLR